MTKLNSTTDIAKKDPGLLVRMADQAYRRPVTDTEEANRQKFEARVIKMNWPQMQNFCKHYHSHLKPAA